MGATGYIISGNNGGSGEPEKTYNVVPADGTIAVERTEANNEVQFSIKTTYDGYEIIGAGSPSTSGLFKVIHVKFNVTNRRYRLVCILNGGSYTPVARDFAIYYIKMGYGTGGVNSNHWYIQEYSRVGNGAYITLEQISLTEYNILMYCPQPYAYANIGVLKEDKEPDVTIEHFSGTTAKYTPTGTLITTDVPTWRNGAPAVWQIIPDVVNPVAGMLGHYYNADRNLYFFDGTNWHLVYSLAQGVASMLATTDAPATATDGTIYYDTTEGNLKIWINGGWQDIISAVECIKPYIGSDGSTNSKVGQFYFLASSSRNLRFHAKTWAGDVWAIASGVAAMIAQWPETGNYNGRFVFNTEVKKLGVYYDGWKYPVNYSDLQPQVVTFTNYSGETIAAEDKPQIVVTASFGSTSILDFSNIEKEEGKVIEISNLNGNTISMKDGATTLHLNNSNESVVKAICLSSVWHFYKTGSITEFT